MQRMLISRGESRQKLATLQVMLRPEPLEVEVPLDLVRVGSLPSTGEVGA
jgi:hypothetical protein